MRMKSWCGRCGRRGAHERRIPYLLAGERVLHQPLGVGPALELRDALPFDPRSGAEARPARLAGERFRLARGRRDDRDVAGRLPLTILRDATVVRTHEAPAGV